MHCGIAFALLLVSLANSTAYAANASEAAQVVVPKHEKLRLGNGIELILLPQPEVPLVAFVAQLRGGGQADPVGKAGLASIVANMLEKGAGSRDAFAFADAVAGVGGSFGASAGAESMTVTGQFLARDRALMIELLADALLRPQLQRAEFDKIRTRQIELIKAAKDSDPSSLLSSYGRAFLFGAHPYGAPLSGSESSLAALSYADALQFFRDHVGADRLTLVFAGDIDVRAVRTAVQRAFARMPAAAKSLAALAPTAPVSGRSVLLVDSPGSVQSYFWMANVGVSRRFPQRAALDIVNTLYGGRFTSILNTELRVKSGLTYGASSAFSRGSVAGEFAISSFTQTENTGKAIDMALETLQRLHREGVSGEMLDSARSYVLGQYPLRLETAGNWAGALADLQFYGLDRSFIESYGPSLAAVSTANAASIVSDVFPKPDNLRMVVIGDAEKIREGLRRFGAITEMKLETPSFSP
jgi:predicted Zn-dependent peptidase